MVNLPSCPSWLFEEGSLISRECVKGKHMRPHNEVLYAPRLFKFVYAPHLFKFAADMHTPMPSVSHLSWSGKSKQAKGSIPYGYTHETSAHLPTRKFCAWSCSPRDTRYRLHLYSGRSSTLQIFSH